LLLLIERFAETEDCLRKHRFLNPKGLIMVIGKTDMVLVVELTKNAQEFISLSLSLSLALSALLLL
jgi:hypothetical protein